MQKAEREKREGEDVDVEEEEEAGGRGSKENYAEIGKTFGGPFQLQVCKQIKKCRRQRSLTNQR